MLESLATATEVPGVVAFGDGRRCRKASAPASSPSASIAGMVDAFCLTDVATLFTRPETPPSSIVDWSLPVLVLILSLSVDSIDSVPHQLLSLVERSPTVLICMCRAGGARLISIRNAPITADVFDPEPTRH